MSIHISDTEPIEVEVLQVLGEPVAYLHTRRGDDATISLARLDELVAAVRLAHHECGTDTVPSRTVKVLPVGSASGLTVVEQEMVR